MSSRNLSQRNELCCTSLIYYAVFHLIEIILISVLCSAAAASFSAPGEMIYFCSIVLFCVIFPSGIGSVVTKYSDRGKAAAVATVKKYLMLFGGGIGLLLVCLILIFGKNSAGFICGNSGMYSFSLYISLILSSCTLMVEGIVSAYRGFYLAFKSAAFTRRLQLVEQVVRFVCFLCLFFVTIKALNMNTSVIPVCFSASGLVGVLSVLFLYYKYDKGHIAPFLREARNHPERNVSGKTAVFDVLKIILPYTVCFLLLVMPEILDYHFFFNAVSIRGMTSEKAEALFSIRHVQSHAVYVFPMLVFIWVIFHERIPSMDRNEMVRYLRENCGHYLEMIFLLILPFGMLFFSLAGQSYVALYGEEMAEYGETIFTWLSFVPFFMLSAFAGTIVMLKGRLKKSAFVYLIVGIIFKCVVFYYGFDLFGYRTSAVSSLICYAVVFYLNFAKIHNRYSFPFMLSLTKILKVILSCLAMNGACVLLKIVNGSQQFLEQADHAWLSVGYVVVSAFIYLYVTEIQKLPLSILQKSWRRLLSFGGKR